MSLLMMGAGRSSIPVAAAGYKPMAFGTSPNLGNTIYRNPSGNLSPGNATHQGTFACSFRNCDISSGSCYIYEGLNAGGSGMVYLYVNNLGRLYFSYRNNNNGGQIVYVGNSDQIANDSSTWNRVYISWDAEKSTPDFEIFLNGLDITDDDAGTTLTDATGEPEPVMIRDGIGGRGSGSTSSYPIVMGMLYLADQELLAATYIGDFWEDSGAGDEKEITSAAWPGAVTPLRFHQTDVDLAGFIANQGAWQDQAEVGTVTDETGING